MGVARRKRGAVRLENRAALVTGGGAGIGEAICLGLAREGAAVAVADLAPDAAQQVAERIAVEGGRAAAIEVDVTSRGSCDRMVARTGARLIVASVEESIRQGRVVEETGPRANRNRLQTTTLLDAIEEHEFDAVFGGGRRDEDKARAKERVFSFRDDFGQWDPKNQRPELWSLYNGRVRRGEHVRVFPISNWTELDVWQYIAEEGLEVPPIYFAHEREVFQRDGMLYAISPFVQLIDGEEPFAASVRYRTVGDMSCTGAVESSAATLEAVVAEIAATRITERGETRADDRVTEAAMEDRKREGYF